MKPREQEKQKFLELKAATNTIGLGLTQDKNGGRGAGNWVDLYKNKACLGKNDKTGKIQLSSKKIYMNGKYSTDKNIQKTRGGGFASLFKWAIAKCAVSFFCDLVVFNTQNPFRKVCSMIIFPNEFGCHILFFCFFFFLYFLFIRSGACRDYLTGFDFRIQR